MRQWSNGSAGWYVSLGSSWARASAYSDSEFIAFETYGRRGVQRGGWKALLQDPPYGTGDWQLYDLDTDLGELRDLSTEQPRIRSEMIDACRLMQSGWASFFRSNRSATETSATETGG